MLQYEVEIVREGPLVVALKRRSVSLLVRPYVKVFDCCVPSVHLNNFFPRIEE